MFRFNEQQSHQRSLVENQIFAKHQIEIERKSFVLEISGHT